jgi:hypothetical protein
MNTAPDLTMSTTIAATDQTKASAAPRIKLLSHGFSIDHPDAEIGEQLMINAMGVADREAMHGILRQLVKASVSGESPDDVNLSFMISMVKSIKPRDSIEAMRVAQMVSVHVMAMRCAHHLANADDLAHHDSAARALGRLARTFPAQIEALNRYRSQGEPAITVQNVSVGDGGTNSQASLSNALPLLLAYCDLLRVCQMHIAERQRKTACDEIHDRGTQPFYPGRAVEGPVTDLTRAQEPHGLDVAKRRRDPPLDHIERLAVDHADFIERVDQAVGCEQRTVFGKADPLDVPATAEF